MIYSVSHAFRFSVLAVLFLLFGSCGAEEEPTVVSVSTADGGFPRIALYNPGGDSVVIEAVSATVGSIGFDRGGTTVWVTGEPQRNSNQDGETLQWDTEAGRVSLEILSREQDDLALRLTADSDLEGHHQWMINLAAKPDEYFTGIFERVVDGTQDESWKDGITTGLNLRGERIEMHLKPTVSAYAPFYISSAGYGFFARGTWPGVFDFASSAPSTVQVSFEGPELEVQLYLGKTVKDIVQQHALETGPSLVPPDWALGPWRWRDEHFNEATYYDGTPRTAPFNTDIVEDVLMMKAYDIPTTAVWIDRPWGPGVRGFDDYEFDTERLPDPEGMIDWLNDNGIELMLWIGPFVMGEMADYAEEHDYDLQGHRWKDSRQVLMDFTNPEAVDWWGEHGPGKLAKMGVKGFKLDRADGEKLQDSLHLTTHAGTTYRENFNDYPRQYVEATHKAVQPVLGDDFVLFPRAQYTGSAKYGSMWAGDTDGKPEGLRSAIIGLQRCAVMGYPVWGSDVGGYWGDFSQETTQRWLGLGCFSPIMETGPTNNEGLWNNPDEPVYDPELIATWRLYSKLRMQLVPYVSDLAVEAREEGTPIARPLFLEYPSQPEAWNDWQTYLFGPDLLVSIIWETGKTEHRLYLPEGTNWVDAWNPETSYAGGQYVTVDAPAYKTPVFVREGAELDLGDLNALYTESLSIASRVPNLAELEAAETWK
ncbi:alpha-glucosidase (family GH31 glycosyl hydrolase) [Lewinella aquimaris]|uniref:Alpha-glucosidase (Family GH31 glycosyl hydrolase) n=1 Tax=Neolewinella aquimaris TaxID=1835722 RepID=A0A840EJD1_9BACT|nr:TIM-barrel domain-containing protein [Neolewinella aquimaris]MBB4080986.1 alpha-glucosidase (family GH31 glycosyl hydrolase) [Neolewinella aquimaris]